MEWVAIPFSRGLPDPGIEPGFPALQADSLPSDRYASLTLQLEKEPIDENRLIKKADYSTKINEDFRKWEFGINLHFHKVISDVFPCPEILPVNRSLKK